MAEAAINGVTKGASSLWNMASGYASQMFTEEDLEATPVLVGSNSEPIILDRCLPCLPCPVDNLILTDVVVHCQAAGSIACFGKRPNNIYQRS